MSSEETIPSLSPEISPIPQGPIEECDQIILTSTSLIDESEQSNSSQSNLVYELNEKSSTSQNVTHVECLSNSENSNTKMVIVTSPSINSNITLEENDTKNDSNSSSSSSFLQTKQRRVDHRRNKSEPFKSASTEDLPSLATLELSSGSTTSNDSPPMSKLAKQSIQEKSSPLSTTSSRKKPWYNPFQSTYRQRNEEFRKIFKDIPNDERLIADYLCAWQKDVLIQGRMYLSQNYLCFYANILIWKTSLCVKFQDIEKITREKTAKVIPNAIEVRSNKSEKYFFASFVARDKTYGLMVRLWQNALHNRSMSTQQLWYIIHENYGDDLDMTTDEEDTYNKPSSNISLNKTLPKEQVQINDKYDRITSDVINPSLLEQEDDRSSVSSQGEHHTDDESIIPIGEPATIDTIKRQSQVNLKVRDSDSNLDKIEICYLAQCPCQSHLATELINRTYSISVEHLFDYIFGDNDFLIAYRASRRIKDFHATEWQVNNETEKRERLCTYKVTVAAVIGSTTVCSNERQVIDCELEKSHYVLDTEIRNEGIKYADAFFVAVRYCFVQIGPNKSHLKVTCEVRYVKSLMAIIKTFIEKNAMAALQDSFNDLNNRIEISTLSDALCSSVKRVDQESCKRLRTLNKSKDSEENVLILNTTRSLQNQQSDDLTSSINDLSINSLQDESIQDEINLSVPEQVFISKNAFFLSFCLLIMFVLLIVNIFLYVKLNQIDRMTDHLLEIYPAWLNKYSYPQENKDWSSLLKIQEEYYQAQLNNLQSILLTTHNALRNVTNTLHELSKVKS